MRKEVRFSVRHPQNNPEFQKNESIAEGGTHRVTNFSYLSLSAIKVPLLPPSPPNGPGRVFQISVSPYLTLLSVLGRPPRQRTWSRISDFRPGISRSPHLGTPRVYDVCGPAAQPSLGQVSGPGVQVILKMPCFFFVFSIFLVQRPEFALKFCSLKTDIHKFSFFQDILIFGSFFIDFPLSFIRLH